MSTYDKPSIDGSSLGEENSRKNELVEQFARVCEKLDELRFANNISWRIIGDNIHRNLKLEASKRLFLFWLCSCIDQFYGYATIWTKGENAMLSLIQGSPKSFQDIDSKVKNQRNDGNGNRIGDILLASSSFSLVRDDYARIKNTFNFLSQIDSAGENIDERFVKVIGRLVSENQGENGILKTAYFLDGWLFSNSPVSKNPTISQLYKFREQPRKRLWMFVMFLRRDPCIRNLLREALLQTFGSEKGQTFFEKWSDDSKFNPKEIELPEICGTSACSKLFCAI